MTLDTAVTGATWSFKGLHFVPATKPDADLPSHFGRFFPLTEVEKSKASTSKDSKHPKSLVARSSKELFRETLLQLQWKTVNKVGPGLANLGNTCFMNAVLQCLTHTPPLAELFLKPIQYGLQRDPIFVTQQHIRKAFQSNSIISPVPHANTLRQSNKSFRLGRQEDAHEYLLCLLDAMHETCLKPLKPKPSPEVAATTFIYRIFGGWLCSQIKCKEVDYESNKLDPFLDLSLGISNATSVEKALKHFTEPEILDGNNKYRCPTTNTLVRAVKRITIEEAPNALTVHLKRFEFGAHGSKVGKRVEYGLTLDLQPFMRRPGCGPQLYDLYAVLVHHGHSLHAGHYICYVKAANGMWHLCDDSRVGQVSERQVLAQQAYILFYARRERRANGSRHGSAAVNGKPASKTVPVSIHGLDAAGVRNVSSKQQESHQVPNGPPNGLHSNDSDAPMMKYSAAVNRVQVLKRESAPLSNPDKASAEDPPNKRRKPECLPNGVHSSGNGVAAAKHAYQPASGVGTASVYGRTNTGCHSSKAKNGIPNGLQPMNGKVRQGLVSGSTQVQPSLCNGTRAAASVHMATTDAVQERCGQPNTALCEPSSSDIVSPPHKPSSYRSRHTFGPLPGYGSKHQRRVSMLQCLVKGRRKLYGRSNAAELQHRLELNGSKALHGQSQHRAPQTCTALPQAAATLATSIPQAAAAAAPHRPVAASTSGMTKGTLGAVTNGPTAAAATAAATKKLAAPAVGNVLAMLNAAAAYGRERWDVYEEEYERGEGKKVRSRQRAEKLPMRQPDVFRRAQNKKGRWHSP